ncbi:uroporphyrinogen-III synthase [Candidatus Acetothermia bacterium]|nr:uroporphyrinogen-III synthase [Candidatus Acetothermia bacterium]
MRVASPQSLRGKRVLVTRAREQAAVLAGKLRAIGAEPILLPMVRFTPLQDFAALDRAIQSLMEYDWVIFTSVNGVRFFFERLLALGCGAERLSRAKLGAIGPATAAALAKCGLSVHFVPKRYLAEEIAGGIGDVRGQRILLPRADIARKALAQALRTKGAHVDEVAVYCTLPEKLSVPDIRQQLQDAKIDVITFTSASTVRNFASVLSDASFSAIVGGVAIACIGPITAKAVEELGLTVHVVAEEHTIDGLLNAIVKELSVDAKDRA